MGTISSILTFLIWYLLKRREKESEDIAGKISLT